MRPMMMLKTSIYGISSIAWRYCAPLFLLLPAAATTAQEKKLDPFNVAYTSATPTRAPLWITKDAGLFEK